MTDVGLRSDTGFLVRETIAAPAEHESLESLLQDVYIFSRRRRVRLLSSALEHSPKFAKVEQDTEEIRRILARKALEEQRILLRAWGNVGHHETRKRYTLSVPATEPSEAGRYLVPEPGRNNAIYEDTDPFEHAKRTAEDTVAVVRLSALLKNGAVFIGGLCVASILYWSVSGAILVNPFLAILMATGVPFVYLMGKRVDNVSSRNDDRGSRV